MPKEHFIRPSELKIWTVNIIFQIVNLILGSNITSYSTYHRVSVRSKLFRTSLEAFIREHYQSQT